jgi:hypothetical protein
MKVAIDVPFAHMYIYNPVLRLAVPSVAFLNAQTMKICVVAICLAVLASTIYANVSAIRRLPACAVSLPRVSLLPDAK